MEKVSRSQKKRLAEALQQSGKKLIALSESQLDALDIPGELKDAVGMAWRLSSKHEAYRRQIQYIGRLMREMDAQQIEMALFTLELGQERQRRRFARIERWRDELVSGDDERLALILDHIPEAERQQLTRLVADARSARKPSTTKSASRKLFRYLSRLEIQG